MEGTIGEIRMFAGTFAPKNWAYCQNQIIAISTNSALFSILGTTYGGNGQTTFALPDFRGRTAVGTGNGPGLSGYELGQMGGSENTTLLLSNMPSHNHVVSGTVTVKATGDGGTGIDPSNRNFGPGNTYTDSTTDLVDMAAGNTDVRLTTVPVGSNAPFSNIQPYLAMNYIICMYGIYPSRN
jgi:microcystin-dependent protein